jgi:carbohydrate kinase (thermoresistant glucokinase family)
MPRPPIIVMGVSGCGKSTIGLLLATELHTTFIDADDLHPSANKQKMASGIPLDDSDREPWLRLVGGALAADPASPPVIACSALKRSYRELLRSSAPDVFFAHLDGSRQLLADRLAARHHEFMSPTLLDSQLATLEPLEPDESGLRIDFSLPPAELVAAIASQIGTP